MVRIFFFLFPNSNTFIKQNKFYFFISASICEKKPNKTDTITDEKKTLHSAINLWDYCYEEYKKKRSL